MEKQKKWQFYLILAVIILTLYNILPTIFYYAKPLRDPIDAERAKAVSVQIADRVNDLEQDSVSWLYSFCKMLHIKPEAIELRKDEPRLVQLTFKNSEDAQLFKRFLPKAGSLIPFVPSQLELSTGHSNLNPNKVLVTRQIGIHIDPADLEQLFAFSPKFTPEGQVAPLYRDITYDRAAQVALGFAGASRNAAIMKAVGQNSSDANLEDAIISLSSEVIEADAVFGKDSLLAKRWFSSLGKIEGANPENMLQKYLVKSESLKTKLGAQREELLKEIEQVLQSGQVPDSTKEQTAALLDNQRQAIDKANGILKNHAADVKSGTKPLSLAQIQTSLEKQGEAGAADHVQVLSLEERNPFVEALIIDWGADKISLKLFKDVEEIYSREAKTEASNYQKEKLNQFIINDIAQVSRSSDEAIRPDGESFSIKLDNLTKTDSILALKLGSVAAKKSEQIEKQINDSWMPSHPDLVREGYPVRDYDAFSKEKPEDQKLGLVIYTPAKYSEPAPAGFRSGSIYVIARGLDSIIQKNKTAANSQEGEQLNRDMSELNAILQQNNFIGYPGSSFGMAPEFAKDYIYELEDYYSNLLKATREDFTAKGSKRYAVLDFSDVEQRMIARNRIDDHIQEDLLKWKEEYGSAQVDLNVTSRYLIPPPTKNVYWENFKLSFLKYFRGDDRKILKWGLDLSGGKTVRIGLIDSSGRPVTDPDDLRKAVDELYKRINNMGVSERTIRIENNNILLDFPGSQGLTAAELVKASAMYFHIVNEKFTPNNPSLREAVNQFLQNVWNEAVVTNRKDIDSINEIAWQQLGGESESGIETRPRSQHAKLLWDSGLRLANPKDKSVGSSFNDTLSAIGMMKGDDFSEWDNQSHPLIVVFHNYALEGSSLNNIQVGYDSSEGNVLTFGIKRSYEGARGGSPRDDFYAWTSQFAEDKIAGTPKENYSQGRGWRMAVILNGVIVTKPSLRAALRDGATISGRFTQREINQLAADLKAGSLSFTPKILSEENISPELGKEARTKGIGASIAALALVVVAMVGYYHFAGAVASCAVLFNILIMWGVLQNLDAALTLPGIAGIVLTIGMAVDANVLVFERIREEFKISGRIASAIQAGYRKAFSAIVDSNITTIIAALILIQFDSGPIKGFAVTLIIGIISSMFTALFMTRYFFAGWVQNPNNKSLSMSQFIGQTHFNFMAQTKKALAITVVVMLLGSYLFLAQSRTMFGMDFTGGYSLNVELMEQPGIPSYRVAASEALEQAGASATDIEVRELSRPNSLRLQLSTSMEEKGHPFYLLPQIYTEGKFAYPYQSNPRIDWVVAALQKAGLQIQPSQLDSLDKNWTVMSGQFSDQMRWNATIGLGLALLCILIYITFRFEFKYAIAAVIGLAHDVIITLGILAIFRWLGFPVQIDLQVVGAIMTLVGYSLNDTIIVFDRVREDSRILRKLPFTEVVNHALNVTLSRTIMTSGTTLLVLLALLFLGGKSIFGFSLVMTIGVIVGTLSSLFIAAPVLVFFHNREEQRLANAHPRKV